MDWHAAIEKHREALKRVVAGLVAMARLAGRSHPEVRAEGETRDHPEVRAEDETRDPHPEVRAEGETRDPHPEVRAEGETRDPHPEVRAEGEPRRTLPRHLHRAILRLLRPAESAARRLVIALAIAAPPVLPPRKPSQSRPAPPNARKPAPLLVRRGVRTGIVLRPGAPVPELLAHLVRPKSAQLLLPLIDPLPRWRVRRWSRAADIPRIGMAADRSAIAARRTPAPDDPLDAGRLGLRLAALASALDDLPGQARRFARWRARRDRALAAGRRHRVTPLRGGRPPGGRLAHYDPDVWRRTDIRDVDEILAHAHGLAHMALNPDTS